MRKIIVNLLIFFGILLIIYPIIANIVGIYSQTTIISSYKSSVNLLDDEQKKKQLEEARKYNEELEKENYIDVSLENTNEENEHPSVLNVMDVGDTIGYIEIPKINVNLPIYQGVSTDILYSGVGHVESSSLPVGGLRNSFCFSWSYRSYKNENI